MTELEFFVITFVAFLVVIFLVGGMDDSDRTST